ncbi:hypothetical protein TsFJ059_000229 [Trichoderma semiorbis]|uniref:Zn(2)-C6 fungal-type domain-containing protein n=1 Tax=Trichoderma semiorbis TaxID=1491008 RepID=A0A9P8I0U9_9HYPO|nr:hypothetical protein TsFJ059_000229 [Trichoderma semiorbis]
MDARAPRKSNRGRRAKACDSCSRRKIQCDADVPQCNWCKHHDLACTYRRLVATTKKKSPDHKITQTPDSITRMEVILAQRLSQHDDDTQFEYLTSSQSDLRNATSFTGIPLFSEKGQAWIESRTGSRMTPQTLCSFGRQWHSPRRLYLDPDTIAASAQPSSSPPTSPVYDKSDRTHHLRDLFWTCYSLDKDLCIRTGQPSCLSDIHCDLTLPPDYSVMQNRHIQSHTIPDLGNRTVPMYPWELLLSQLKSRAYDALYSPMAHRKSQCELLESIRVLDESLEQWRLSLPPDFRPTLTFGKMTPVSADVSMQSSMVRLAYYHFVAIIHRASGRCMAQSPGNYHEGVRSSFNLSLDASRSTLVYLRVALHVITDDCFWVIIYYPISAILALFSNILSSPLDETAPGDLEILKSAPTLFRIIPIRKLTLAELTHLKLLDAFSMELARLGELAIQKARGNVPTHG